VADIPETPGFTVFGTYNPYEYDSYLQQQTLQDLYQYYANLAAQLPAMPGLPGSPYVQQSEPIEDVTVYGDINRVPDDDPNLPESDDRTRPSDHHAWTNAELIKWGGTGNRLTRTTRTTRKNPSRRRTPFPPSSSTLQRGSSAA
jgi:hypothetical protein